MASLRPGGTAIFAEPIAFSRRLQRVRDLVPIDKRASPGERPLSHEEVTFAADQLIDPEITYFNLLGRLRRLLPNRHRLDQGSYPVTRAALFLLYGLDRVLLGIVPALRRLSGSVVIVGKRPVAGSAR
jgi:hypothetical protein